MLSIGRLIGRGIVVTAALLLALVALVIGVDVVGAIVFRYPPVLRFVLHELPFRGEQFDKEQWIEAGSCEGLSDGDCMTKQAHCPRGGMVRNLVNEYLMPEGTTRGTVAGLIGPAEYDVEIEGRACDAYSLGMCSGLGWDYDSLYVCYGDDGKIVGAGHVQH